MKKPTSRKNYDLTDGEIPLLRWSTRRKMAWRAFTALVIGTLLYWFALPLFFHLFALPEFWLSTIGTSYSWFASTCALIIATYMGVDQLPKSMNFGGKSTASQREEIDNIYQEQNDVQDAVEEEYYEPKR